MSWIIILVLVFQVLILGISLFIARKVVWASKAAGAASSASVTTTQQLEALDGLYWRTGLPRGALPPSRGWAGSPDFLCHIADTIMERRPEMILECGSGVSTIVIAQCCKLLGGGKVISLDHDPVFGQKTRERLAALDLQDFAEVKVLPLTDQSISGESFKWYDLSATELPEGIDLVVVDGPPAMLTSPEGRYPVGPLVFPSLSKQGVALFDDTNRPGERNVLARLAKEFPQLRAQRLFAEKGCVLLTPAGE